LKTTASILELLREYECRNVTFVDAEGGWPIVWARARGAHVWDAEGRKYLDLKPRLGWRRRATPTREWYVPGKSRWPPCFTQWATSIRTR
jgi:hypothetical protein